MKKEKILYSNFRHMRKMEVLKIEVNEGDGTLDDPVTRVAYICSLGGKVLAKIGDDKERKFIGEDELIEL